MSSQKESELAEDQSQEFLDNNQYTLSNIKHYEVIFGKMFVSTGGKDTTKAFVDMLQIGKGKQVLDIGSGVGGSAFYIAENCQAKFLGVDLSRNMISQAKNYLMDMNDVVKENVEFQNGDITKMKFEENSFDYIYSREVTIYIQDKELLFSNFLKWLKPGGKILVSDYCFGTELKKSEDFLSYEKKRGYHMRTVGEHGSILNKVGFEDVRAEDRTDECVKILKSDLDRFMRDKHKILSSITRAEYDDIVSMWELKLKRCQTGDQAWGLFTGTK